MSIFGSKKTKYLTNQQKQLLRQLTTYLGPQMGEGVEAYPGQMVAEMDPLQAQGFEEAAGFGTGEMAEAREGALLSAMNAPQEYVEQFRSIIRDPTLAAYRETTARDIAHRYGSGGNIGAAQKMTADSMAGLFASLAQGETEMLRFGYGQRAEAVPMSREEEMARIQVPYQAGTARRGVEQELLAEPYAKWQMAQAYNNPWMTQFLPLALGTPAVTAQGPGAAGNITGGIIQGLQPSGMMSSFMNMA